MLVINDRNKNIHFLTDLFQAKVTSSDFYFLIIKYLKVKHFQREKYCLSC